MFLPLFGFVLGCRKIRRLPRSPSARGVRHEQLPTHEVNPSPPPNTLKHTYPLPHRCCCACCATARTTPPPNISRTSSECLSCGRRHSRRRWAASSTAEAAPRRTRRAARGRSWGAALAAAAGGGRLQLRAARCSTGCGVKRYRRLAAHSERSQPGHAQLRGGAAGGLPAAVHARSSACTRGCSAPGFSAKFSVLLWQRPPRAWPPATSVSTQLLTRIFGCRGVGGRAGAAGGN